MPTARLLSDIAAKMLNTSLTPDPRTWVEIETFGPNGLNPDLLFGGHPVDPTRFALSDMLPITTDAFGL